LKPSVANEIAHSISALTEREADFLQSTGRLLSPCNCLLLLGDAGLERFDGSDVGQLSYGESPNWGEAKGEAFSSDWSEDEELRRLVTAWRILTDEVRAAILSLLPDNVS
jgi:hypothetical protein